MALTQTQISQLYVSIFGRASEGEGNSYWQTQGTISEVASKMLATDAASTYFGTSLDSNQDFIEHIYLNTLGKTYAEDTAGVDYWVSQLTAGTSRGDVVANLIAAAQSPENAGAAQDQFNNKVAVSDYVADTIATADASDLSEFTSFVSSVTDSDATVTAAKAAVDSAAEEEGETTALTDGRDTVTGTDGADTFIAEVGQNQDGALANAFSTGDVIDGGASTDTLEAAIMGDNGVDNSFEDFAINAKTTNLEIVKLTALDEDITVDAGRMDSVEEFWSNNSDDVSLTIEDVRLGSKLSITDDLSFGMQSVDFDSDFEAQLDSQSFQKDSDDKLNSQIIIEVGDSNKPASSTNPLELIELSINFTFGGESYSLELESTDGTYEGLKTAVEEALTANGLTGLNVTFGTALSEITAENDTVPLVYTGAKQIIITDPEGTEFTQFTSGVGAKPSAQSSNPVSNTTANAPTTSTPLIETNILLDDAGRGSMAGDFEVGGMSNSGEGIEKFDVYVDRDSSIASLTTTNEKLQEIEINSKDFDNDANTTATGSLEIGSTQDNLTLIEADAFAGTALTLGTKIAVNNLVQLDASIAGDVTFIGETTQADHISSNNAYDYDTGAGNDTITFDLDGDSVDTIGESFSINAGNGDNTVTVNMQGSAIGGTGVSVGTTAALDNLSITTGSGVDNVTLIGGDNNIVAGADGDADFNISTGAGSDFVYINSIDDNDSADASKGTWTVGTATGATPETVYYKALVTVDFAGFEQNMAIITTAANNFVATQVEINDAIIKAIEANPELSRLLTTTLQTGTQELVIDSTVEGENELNISITQPNYTAAQISAGDISALNAGFVQTAAAISTASDSAAEIQTIFATNLTDVANVGTTGTNGGSANETTVTNVSTIDLGTGSNDLVVLNSDEDSIQTIVFSAAWDKVSVVNFELIGEEGAQTIAEAADTNINMLDFTAWLDDEVSPSGSTLSNTAVATTYATATTLGQNTVVAVDFATQIDGIDGSATNTFATLTDAQVLAALNADATFATVVDAGTIGTNARDSIILIENSANLGEYKAYNVTYSDNAANDEFASATLVGTIDFGNEVDLVTANLA